MATQIGTIANRTFRDDEGRITKEIFYTLKPDFVCLGGGEEIRPPDPRLPKARLCKTAEPPYSEAMLAEHSIRFYTYDDRGRKIKEEQYSPGMYLTHKWETEYDDNKGRREIKYTPEGIKTYEIRFVERSSVSHLDYDDSGKNLVAIRGLIPQDIDLPFGWGEPVDGLSCGIAHSKIKSSIDNSPVDAIYVNVKNIGSNNIILEETEADEIELRDRFGALVRETAEYMSYKQNRLQKHRQGDRKMVKPGESELIYHPYELQVRYGYLPQGQYSVRVIQPVGDTGTTIVSNTIHFEVKR